MELEHASTQEDRRCTKLYTMISVSEISITQLFRSLIEKSFELIDTVPTDEKIAHANEMREDCAMLINQVRHILLINAFS